MNTGNYPSIRMQDGGNFVVQHRVKATTLFERCNVVLATSDGTEEKRFD